MHKQFSFQIRFIKTALMLLTVMMPLKAASPVAVKTLIDYFQPTPIYNHLSSAVWGAAGVIPRNVCNGLEDSTMKQWQYWDGKIIKGPDGKYHMFASRWDQSKGMSGWGRSVAVHAVSDSPTGPYIDKGICYPNNQAGKGHNVTATALPDGRFAIIVSDTRPAEVFISSSLDGPWAYQGPIAIDPNGFDSSGTRMNLCLCIRPDGNFLMATRFGIMMLSTSGIMGPYKVQGGRVYQNVTGLNNSAREDPCLWFSGGKYHLVVNWYNDRKAYHFTSPNGLTNWTNEGLAYDPTSNFVRYTDGTVNHWYKMERLNVLIENGHPTHFTLAVIDVDKSLDVGNDKHGTKVIVVPFDGAGFDGGASNLTGESFPGNTRVIHFTAKGHDLAIKKTFLVPASLTGGVDRVSIALYDLKGRLVDCVYSGPLVGGAIDVSHNLNWQKVSSGAYCITLRCGTIALSDRITIQ